MTLLIIYGLVSIAFSFLCSILEAVLLSVTPTFISIKMNEEKPYAFQLKKLKENINQPLISILTVNTIAHTVGAILVGVQAEKTFGSGNNAVGIVSAIMTVLILVVSEIIPKTIGANYWKQLANFTAKAIMILIIPLKYTGVLWFLELVTKLFGKHVHEANVSREEFHAMADIAHEEGVFLESESNVIKNLINFEKIYAKDIMTPRTVLKLASQNKTIQAFYDENPNLKFSRIPIYAESPDDITGYILKDQLYEALIHQKGDETLRSIRREIFIAQRETPIKLLFEQLIESQEHFALIVDEYGSVSGIVSQEDIIETLLGLEIVDESDSTADLQILARRMWKKRADRLGITKRNQSPDED